MGLKDIPADAVGLKRSLCSQVYKATGEEFLKIAGGQISALLPPSMFGGRLVLKGFLLA